jgi:hypothetical protein
MGDADFYGKATAAASNDFFLGRAPRPLSLDNASLPNWMLAFTVSAFHRSSLAVEGLRTFLLTRTLVPLTEFQFSTVRSRNSSSTCRNADSVVIGPVLKC